MSRPCHVTEGLVMPPADTLRVPVPAQARAGLRLSARTVPVVRPQGLSRGVRRAGPSHGPSRLPVSREGDSDANAGAGGLQLCRIRPS
jgi:hypothetical protein